MKILWFKIVTSVKLFFVSLFHKEPLSAQCFENLFKIHEMCIKSCTDDHPYRACLFLGDKKISSIWIYPGTSKSPVDRIEELQNEVASLKEMLNK